MINELRVQINEKKLSAVKSQQSMEALMLDW
jgi:hypothetical protein